MAGKSTISITFKLDGDGKGFRALAQDANGLKKVLTETVSEAQKLNTNAINFAAIATGIDQAQQSIAALQSTLKGLTDAYAVQQQAETQLETVMRQRMNASAEDIQAIKDLASAQQELGVIGDEVQLAGAQQVATFLTQRQSIETLLPAMNNLLAQQKGLNATSGDAVNIANLMGKAMQGQTGALRRVGITFDAAQENIMKYGTEAQRAAMLAEIIQQNVGDMNAQLAATDSGKQKQLENTLGDIKEQLGGLVQGAMPFVTIAANTMLALAGTMKFVAGVKVAAAAVAGWNVKTKAASVLLRLSGLDAKKAAVGVNILSSSHKSAAVTAHLLKGALRGLMIATGVGIAIAALTTIIEFFVSKSDSATKATNKLIDAEERAKAEAERVDQLRQQETSTQENTRAALEINIQKLKNFNGTKAQEQKLVSEMNDTYGETMGYFSSVSQWYDALINNSEAYCRQMVIEARTRMLANQIAQKEQESHDIRYNSDGTAKRYSTVRQVEQYVSGYYTPTTGGAAGGPQPQYSQREIPGTSDLDKANAALAANAAAVADLKQQLENAAQEASQISFKAKGSTTRPTGTADPNKPGGAGAHQQEKTELQQLNDLINQGREDYVNASEAERAEIQKNIAAWTTKRRAIELLQAEAARPTELKTLQDIDDEIAYQQARRRSASAEALAGIDAEINHLGQLRSSMEQTAHVPVPVDRIQTYEELNRELAYYTKLLQTASATERDEIQKQINALNELKRTWDETLNDLSKPGEISTLNTIDDLDKAISYYQAKQKKASADEVSNIQATIDALERKRAAMNRGVDLAGMTNEANAINGLSGSEYKIKIRGIGFEELTARINELRRTLDDVENPPTDGQRAQIENLIGIYEKWRGQVVNTFDTYREGYNGIKNIGSGIQSINDAIEGSDNAWQKATAIIDGFLQLYDGIKTVIGIINMLSAASTAHSATKLVEAGAETTESATRTTMAATNAAAAGVTIAANKLETASWAELAAAMTFAAHASIPFAGTAIAAGFIATQQAIIAAAGIPKFAKGGIAYGPTLGLFGEYAGASTNPEVVAPLDKLRNLIQPAGAAVVSGRFRVEGRDLVAVLANETRVSSKSGKRTNIKI